jgi:hypothetical protein
MLKTSLANLATVKIGVAATAVMLTIGGVAIATAGSDLLTDRGNTPLAPTNAVSPSTGQGNGPPPWVPASPPDDPGKPGGDDDNGGGNGGSGNGDQPSPSPSLEGLCHAYTSGSDRDKGKSLDNPAFGYLITTAGGRDKVDSYCATLLAEKNEPGPPEDKQPPQGGKPKDTQPTVRPNP